MEIDETTTAIMQTIKYIRMVLISTLKAILRWAKPMKFLFGFLILLLMFDCLVFAALIGAFPPFIMTLVNDFSAEIRLDLTRATIAILFLVFIFPFLFIHEASKIHVGQAKIIAERIPGQFALSIERLPSESFIDGKNINLAAINVKNLEKKKIIEFQALIHYEHFDYTPETNRVSQASIEDNALLFWIGQSGTSAEKMIELRPDIPRTLLICDIASTKTENGDDINLARMGSDIVRYGMSYTRESIFQINIMFQGKLEGEYEFKTFHYSDLIYGKPSENRILLSDHPEQIYNDIPAKLLNRGKTKIEYFEIKIRI